MEKPAEVLEVFNTIRFKDTLTMTLQVTGFFIPIIVLLGIASLTSIIISAFKLRFLPVFAVEIFVGIAIASWFNKFMLDLNMTAVVDGIYVLGLSLLDVLQRLRS